MTGWAYYNEFDPFAAAWIRELIKAGHVAPGEVDERSIEDVAPDDLNGFTQCHFFAGIAVWSYALRRVGVPDNFRIWTGSPPCQPFSAAGKGNGFADERHLWPHFFHLITQCRPSIVVGEQVASKDGLAWLDLVQADMEGAGHAFGAVDLCAAGVGAPHIRQRLWWVGKRLADANGGNSGAERQQRGGQQRQQPKNGGALLMEHAPGGGREQWGSEPSGRGAASGYGVGRLDHHHHPRLEGQRGGYQAESGRVGEVRPVAEAGELVGVADAANLAGPQKPACNDTLNEQRSENGRGPIVAAGPGADGGNIHGGHSARRGEIRLALDVAAVERPGPTNGLWRDADWLHCRDGKWRPVEPGTFPLAHGAAARVGRLRGYGNAIVAPVAEEFLRAALLDELVNSAV